MSLKTNKPDAFSIRATPSVMGAIWRTIRFAKEEVERELNGVSDNPLIFHGSDDTTDADIGEWIETGTFHGASIGLAMDHLATALTQLATLSERRIFKLTHGKLSNNLPVSWCRARGSIQDLCWLNTQRQHWHRSAKDWPTLLLQTLSRLFNTMKTTYRCRLSLLEKHWRF